MDEQVEALKEWLDEGKAPDDFRRVTGMSKETFEELLASVMSPTVAKVVTPTLVVEDDDE
tara:strand:+ start:179 stop:358 length:180 start_codon:yes stop_codon:yes gene_type:complete